MTPFAIPFPAIDPVLLQIGPFAIRWYALAYVAGLLIGWRYAVALVRQDRLWGAVPRPAPVQMDDFLLWATLGVVLGGRLGYVLFYDPAQYVADPLAVLFVWQGGMAFHGGFLGVTAAMILFARNQPFSLFSLTDVVSAVVPIGIFFGRLANFINAELYGRTTDMPWGVVFPGAGPDPRHPSQLYEAALEGALLFAVLIWLIYRQNAFQTPGRITGVFVVGYGLARMVSEVFRMPDAHIGFLFGGVTMGMILSLPMVVAGIAILIWSARRPAEMPR